MCRSSILRAIAAAFMLLLSVLAMMSASVTAHASALAKAGHASAAVTVRAIILVHTDRISVLMRYTVVPGNTLSGIAQSKCGRPDDWTGIYGANRKTIGPDPNLIFPGQVLDLKCATAPVSVKTTVVRTNGPGGKSSCGEEDDIPCSTTSHGKHHSPPIHLTSSGGLSGTLGCAGLEALWIAAGGRSGAAFMAAEIAMAESSGRQFAVSPTNDYGYWQINRSAWGAAMASFDPMTNARSAITISHDGSNWSPWTTYTSGAYHGRC